LILTHNDADGLAAGAIFATALARAGHDARCGSWGRGKTLGRTRCGRSCAGQHSTIDKLAHPTRFELVTSAFGGAALYPAELQLHRFRAMNLEGTRRQSRVYQDLPNRPDSASPSLQRTPASHGCHNCVTAGDRHGDSQEGCYPRVRTSAKGKVNNGAPLSSVTSMLLPKIFWPL
jgi:hypothetical protein